MIPRSFTVLIDTKEKKPWSFTSSQILGVEYTHLYTGDYTVSGLENILCIERKASAAELAHNVNEERFKRELERMQEYKYKYIILESSMQKIIDYPKQENLPIEVINKIKMSGSYLLKCLNRMQVKYGINIIYCDNPYNAQWVATNIMKEVVELHANDIK